MTFSRPSATPPLHQLRDCDTCHTIDITNIKEVIPEKTDSVADELPYSIPNAQAIVRRSKRLQKKELQALHMHVAHTKQPQFVFKENIQSLNQFDNISKAMEDTELDFEEYDSSFNQHEAYVVLIDPLRSAVALPTTIAEAQNYQIGLNGKMQ